MYQLVVYIRLSFCSGANSKKSIFDSSIYVFYIHSSSSVTFTSEKTIANHLDNLRRDLSPQQLLQSITILGKLFDTLMKLIKSNLVLEEIPTKFGFVINEGNLGDFVGGFGGYFVNFFGIIKRANGPMEKYDLPRMASNFLGIKSLESISAS